MFNTSFKTLDETINKLFQERGYSKYSDGFTTSFFVKVELSNMIEDQLKLTKTCLELYQQTNDEHLKSLLGDYGILKKINDEELLKGLNSFYSEEHLETTKEILAKAGGGLLYYYLTTTKEYQEKFSKIINLEYLSSIPVKVTEHDELIFDKQDVELKRQLLINGLLDDNTYTARKNEFNLLDFAETNNKNELITSSLKGYQELFTLSKNSMFLEKKTKSMQMPIEILQKVANMKDYPIKNLFEDTIDLIQNIEEKTKQNIKNKTNEEIKQILLKRLKIYGKINDFINNNKYFPIYFFDKIEKEDTKIEQNQTLLKILAQTKEKIHKVPELKPFYETYNFNFNFLDFTDDLTKINIANYFLTDKDLNIENEFVAQTLNQIKQLRHDSRLKKEIEQIVQEHEEYKIEMNKGLSNFLEKTENFAKYQKNKKRNKLLEQELNLLKEKFDQNPREINLSFSDYIFLSKYFENKHRKNYKSNKSQKIRQAYIVYRNEFITHLAKKNEDYEKNISLQGIKGNKWLAENDVIGFSKNFLDEAKNIVKIKSLKLAIDEMKELKIMQAIKKRATETIKDTEAIQNIRDIEDTIIKKISYLRKLNKNDAEDYFFNKTWDERYLKYDVEQKKAGNTHIAAIVDSNFFNSFNFLGTKAELKKHRLSSSSYSETIHKIFDCLNLKNKYELNGLALFNNSSSVIASLKINETNLGSKATYALSRAFLYDVNVEGKKGLFVAGVAGMPSNPHVSLSLDKIPQWEKVMYKTIEEYAKLNGYEQIFVNAQPLGDVRSLATRFNHDFVNFVAGIAPMPQDHYTFEKIGSGRKPKFFEMKPEFKEQYVQDIKITRDEDLIGEFYIEGMYTKKEDAIRTRIARKPQHEEFKPEFIYDRGYAPIIKIKL